MPRTPLPSLLYILLVACIGLNACIPKKVQQQESFVFGTRVEVLVVDDDETKARSALKAVMAEFDRLHRNYHAWQESELTRLNSAIANKQAFQASPELTNFLRHAQTISQNTDGLFDPGIGHLIALWGFHSDTPQTTLPPLQEIKQILEKKASIVDLDIKPTGLIQSANPAVSLDFGGYLKGAALDRARNILKARDIHHALINIGGNIMALGNKRGTKDGAPWRVGIKHPRQSGALASLALHNGEAIGTSGDYQRYFELQGKRYSHLINPHSGQPVDHTQTVSIITAPGKNAGVRSDALSKPLFIAGAKKWPEMAKKMGVKHILHIDYKGNVSVSNSLLERLEFIGKKPPINVVP